MQDAFIRTIIANVDSFPVLPTVVTRVMQITANPDSSINDLMKVIEVDQSLTIAILKLANSAFFGLSREVKTLQQALSILGFSEIRNLTLTKAVFNSFKGLSGQDGFNIKRFWEHAFLCGIAAKTIISYIKEENNEFFVAGIVHDIGKLVIFKALPDDFAKIIGLSFPNRLNTFKAEKDILGITHDEIGMKLLKRWMFPENLIVSVGSHHNPLLKNDLSLFSFVIHVADLFAHMFDKDHGADYDDPLYIEEYLFPYIINLCIPYGINWNESDLETVQKNLLERKEKESGVFSLFAS
ncbi:MAG: HDOD domain-containing protein [Desulfobacterales bacterium]|nr:HDOD domain-containing protein [Desulfobacterales bacterium]